MDRLRQTSGQAEDIKQAPSQKEEIESELRRHKEEARESCLQYKSMIEKCKQHLNHALLRKMNNFKRWGTLLLLFWLSNE